MKISPTKTAKQLTILTLCFIFAFSICLLLVAPTTPCYAISTEDTITNYTLNWDAGTTFDNPNMVYEGLDISVRVNGNFIEQRFSATVVSSFMQQQIHQTTYIYIVDDENGNYYVITYKEDEIYNLQGDLLLEEKSEPTVSIKNISENNASLYVGSNGLDNMFTLFNLPDWRNYCDTAEVPIISNVELHILAEGFDDLIRTDMFYLTGFEVTDINSTITGVDTLPECCRDYKNMVE